MSKSGEARIPAGEEPPERKRGRKPREKAITITKVTRVFLNEFSLEEHMMKEAAQAARKFRDNLH